MGNGLSESFDFFDITIQKCDPGTSAVTCESDANINAYVQDIEVGVYMVSFFYNPQANAFFDFDDYDNPIKTYIDDRLFFHLIGDMTKSAYVNIQYGLCLTV